MTYGGKPRTGPINSLTAIPNLAALLNELRSEIRAESRASQIGIAARHIRNYVLKTILEISEHEAQDKNDDDIFKELAKWQRARIAGEWLQTRRGFWLEKWPPWGRIRENRSFTSYSVIATNG